MQLITYKRPEMRTITVYQDDTIANSWTTLILLEKIEAFLKDKIRKSKLSNKQFFYLLKIYDQLIAYKNFDRQQEQFLNDILKDFNYESINS